MLGTRGPDDHGNYRPKLCQCMVLGRPVVGAAELVTFVDEPALQQLYPVCGPAEVVVLARVTDFFLGLNAG